MRGGGSLEESHSYVSDIFGMWHVSVTLVSMTTGDRFNKWSSPMSWNHRIKISSVFGGKDLILTECWLILLTMCLKEVLKEACVCVCAHFLNHISPCSSLWLCWDPLRSTCVYLFARKYLKECVLWLPWIRYAWYLFPFCLEMTLIMCTISELLVCAFASAYVWVRKQTLP